MKVRNGEWVNDGTEKINHLTASKLLVRSLGAPASYRDEELIEYW